MGFRTDGLLMIVRKPVPWRTSHIRRTSYRC